MPNARMAFSGLIKSETQFTINLKILRCILLTLIVNLLNFLPHVLMCFNPLKHQYKSQDSGFQILSVELKVDIQVP